MATQPAPEAGGPSWLGLIGGLVRRQWQSEWHGSPIHLMGLAGRRADGLAADPHDLRPVDPQRGAEILEGQWRFAGEVIGVGPGGDPWDRPSPSRPFAESLHQMGWLGDLLAVGEAGEREALRLVLDWRRTFGRWNSFAWEGPILERRVFNLACGLRRICALASDAETALLVDALGRQARHLLRLARHHGRTAEHAAAATLAGLALAGEAGLKLAASGGERLDEALARTVLADGGHASRSPQAGLELLFDLLTLDEAFSQRGRPPPEEVSRAADRLAAALRLLTLPDGRLPCFQGGEAGNAADLAAAQGATDLPQVPLQPAMGLPHAGYQRLAGRRLTVIADIAAPARGEFAETACAQPLAVEIFAGTERLITNAGWSPKARASQALRLTSAGSTVSIDETSAGTPLTGLAARALGPRLADAAGDVRSRLHQSEQGVWLDLTHDGWLGDFSLRHERLIYLGLSEDDLRGEDRLIAVHSGRRPRMLPMAVRFHLDPQVRASLARDGKSILIQGQASAGWWLRNDADDVAIEASVHFEDGEPKRTTQVVLRSQIASDIGGRIRWKLAPVKPQP